MYSPYDFNQAIAHRAEYVEERLKSGSPVVALSCADGVLLAAPKREQPKIFEIYDRLIYSALGNQTDVESVRLAAIDFAHQEGFVRAPADVSIQRLVGFAISPSIKRAFSDPTMAPYVLRGIFAEVGNTPEDDLFYIVNYDGEFSIHHDLIIIGGDDDRCAKARESTGKYNIHLKCEKALEQARQILITYVADNENNEDAADNTIAESLKKGELDAAILERNSARESTFRRL